MHLIFNIQEVEFRFEIDSNHRLGEVTDMMAGFARDVDRVQREREADPNDDMSPRPLIHKGLILQADIITLHGHCLKDRYSARSTHELAWNPHNKEYFAWPKALNQNQQ